MDTVREKNNLADSYGQVKDIPPLLICNQNNKYRIPKLATNNSVLLQDAGIDYEDIKNLTGRNFNDVIYQRNLPFGRRGETVDSPFMKQSGQEMKTEQVNLPLKIESRPVLSGLCINKRAIQERDSLDRMNQYVPNNGKCNNTVYVPGRGPINHYFDNIDVESQLKNINEIDTKCSAQLFKVNPNGPDTNLYCYKDTIVKDYQKCESKNGYTWCNYNTEINFDTFPVCDSKNFSCSNEMNSPSVSVNSPSVSVDSPSVSVNSPSEVVINSNNQSGRIVNQKELNNVTKELYLSQRKRELDTQINMRRNDPNFSIQRENITQYKGNGINNITSPTLIKQEVDDEMAQMLGERAYIDKEIKKITNHNININNMNNVNNINVNNMNNINVNNMNNVNNINVNNMNNVNNKNVKLDRQSIHNRVNRQVNPDEAIDHMIESNTTGGAG